LRWREARRDASFFSGITKDEGMDTMDA
jgi:hypothetical protein